VVTGITLESLEEALRWQSEKERKIKRQICEDSAEQALELWTGVTDAPSSGGVISKLKEGSNIFLQVACFSEVNIRRA